MDNPQLPRLAFTLGETYNECSIASAELAHRVDALFEDSKVTSHGSFLVIGEPADQLERLSTIPVTGQIQTPSGRPVQLMLGLGVEFNWRPRLFAVTRGYVAFPLASFVRRPGSQCDYVQFGPEMTDETLVVTPKDETSRHDIVESMRNIVDADPLPLIYGDVIKESLVDLPGEKLKSEARWLGNLGTPFTREEIDYAQMAGISRTRRELELLAVLVACQEIQTFGTDHLRHHRYYQKELRKLAAFLKHPNFDDIEHEKVPGSDHPEARKLLIRKVAEQLGYLDYAHRYQDPKANKYAMDFLALTNVDEQLDARLGTYRPQVEKVIRLVGKLANRGEMRAQEVDMPLSNTHGDVDLFVDAKDTGAARTYVAVRARPSAMPDVAPADVYNLLVDRAAELKLEDPEAEELAHILGKVALGLNSNGR